MSIIKYLSILSDLVEYFRQVLYNKGNEELQHNYTGHWWFVDVKKATQHTLEITSSFNVFIDGKQTHALLVELTPKRLVILDKLGYHLIIQCENGVPATLSVEADDETYTLERAIYN